MAPGGLKHMLDVIGRKIFQKVSKPEVEYGQTLTKKRRRNCVLKSVSSLSSSDERSLLVHPTYRIQFEFSKDESQFRGSVMNFQKIDPADVCCLRKCCDKCFCDAASRCSVSSDSACDVTSTSSCEDLDCKFRRRTKSLGNVAENVGTVEDFIRIHTRHFQDGVANPGCDLGTVNESFRAEPDYETLGHKYDELQPKREDPQDMQEPDYDVLLTRPNYTVLEPRYENLKSLENLYETPRGRGVPFSSCSDNCPFKKIKDLVHSNKTYDEVIESLKLLHSSSTCQESATGSGDLGDSCCGRERADNEINFYFDNFSRLQNEFNNDIEHDLMTHT